MLKYQKFYVANKTPHSLKVTYCFIYEIYKPTIRSLVIRKVND